MERRGCLERLVFGYETGVMELIDWLEHCDRSYAFSSRAREEIEKVCLAFLTLVEQRGFKHSPLHGSCFLLGKALCQAVQWGTWARSFMETAEEEAVMAKAENEGQPWLSVSMAYELDRIAEVFQPIALEHDANEICLLEECYDG